MHEKKISFLALGDSYTIGEGLAFRDNFPSQAVSLLREEGYDVSDPVIIAKTGWTTDELQDAISKADLMPSYDWVTLLIGVNNQYRGRNVDEYKTEFESLLQQACGFTGNNNSHVIVLSIPDWGYTPFAADRDREKIRIEIDNYNSANKDISAKWGVHYIDITPGTRLSASQPGMLAEDGLHPSAKEYRQWAVLLVQVMKKYLRG